MLATSGTHSLAGMQATAMMQATTTTPRAAEMPETLLTPTTSDFRRNSQKNSSERQKFHEKIRKKSKNHLFCQVLASPILSQFYLKCPPRVNASELVYNYSRCFYDHVPCGLDL
jgi:hypothetical protein